MSFIKLDMKKSKFKWISNPKSNFTNFLCSRNTSFCSCYCSNLHVNISKTVVSDYSRTKCGFIFDPQIDKYNIKNELVLMYELLPCYNIKFESSIHYFYEASLNNEIIPVVVLGLFVQMGNSIVTLNNLCLSNNIGVIMCNF